MADRERSASPAREPRPKKQKTGGFKWKDKKPKDDDAVRDSRDSGRLGRGYRDRSPRRDSYREHEDDRERRDEDGQDMRRGREPERKGIESSRPTEEARTGDPLDRPSNAEHSKPNPGTDVEAKFGKPKSTSSTASAKPAKAKAAKPKAPAAPTSPMIIVHVNDRLGTKAAIPCLASDTIKQFKAMVAAHIGRKPHEIMLKRQGQRAFKDHITLADYEISNGVQLDLELDTGD